MINYLRIEGLNGSTTPIELSFNNDLNLLTGLNGCGKTTILKILWYINSGHFVELTNEVILQSVKLVSDKYEIHLTKNDDSWSVKCLKGKKEVLSNKYPNNPTPLQLRREVLDFSKFLIPFGEESVFFPTFRRIEGGFSMENRGTRYRRESFPLKDALSELSEELSSDKHQFIASVSTDDITSLLNTEYSAIVREINDLQSKQFEQIRKRIKERNKKPQDVLKAIEKDINIVEKKRNDALKPFTALETLIMKIFHKKGIEMNLITFGDQLNAISSDKLSAGEKQMLSFLCYNTFSKNKVIFIDEPELSLHPDWQRLLIPTLLKQDNNNQFFIATHSPFIYTKYTDKEIVINSNKGE